LENKQKLIILQKQYDTLILKYTEQHPDVTKLKKAIKKLQQAIEEETKVQNEAAPEVETELIEKTGDGQSIKPEVTNSATIQKDLGPAPIKKFNKLYPLDCEKYPEAAVCWKFTDQGSVDALFPEGVSRGCGKGPLYDQNEKAGRLTVSSECGANSSGLFRFDWKAMHDDIWVQFRFKAEKGLIREAQKYGIPSWKLFVLWRGSSSCTDQEFTGTNAEYRGFPQFYESCGAHGYKTDNPTGNNKYNYDMQPGGETHCFYKWRETETKPCFEFKEKWATYTFFLDLDGSKHNGVPTVKGWAQYDGEQRFQILEFPLKYVRFLEHGYFGPYMSYKNNTIIHPEWSVWYQDFLITEKALISE